MYSGAVSRTGLQVHHVLFGRLDQIGNRRFEGVIRSQDININDGLERIGRQLINGRQEVASGASAATTELWLAYRDRNNRC